MFSRCFLRGRFGLVGFVASSLLVLMVVVTDVQAKRDDSIPIRRSYSSNTRKDRRTGGCFAYGHSCLGGLGKRADVVAATDVVADEVEGRRPAATDVLRGVSAARLEGPEGMPWPWLEVDDNAEMMPVGRQRQLTPQQLYQLSPLLRQLLRSVRNNQDLNVLDV